MLAVCIWFGFSLLRLTGVALGPERRWVAGRLSWATITGSLVVFVLVWFVLLTACLAVPRVWMNAYDVPAPVPEGVAAVEHI